MDSAHATTVDHGGHGDGHGGGHGDLMLVGHDGQLHAANLQHHFVSAQQQFEASKLGMWLFLVTEILLFGGMFVAYAIYRAWYPELFEDASLQLDTVMGALNTVVLLASSLTVAWAIRGAQRDDQRVLFWNLVATVLLAGTFMVVKYFEYTHKFELGIFPGESFELAPGTIGVDGQEVTGTRPVAELLPAGESHAEPTAADHATAGAEPAADEHADGAAGAGAEHGAEGEHAEGEVHGREGPIFSNPRAGVFFSIYYVMTGIHGLHVLIGMVAISILAWKARRGRYSSVYYTPVENVGLYWHVVDIIWIFLFPLMYLI
jgi:cytochrome c oxidase subunit 3